MTVSLVVPTLNEAGAVPALFAGLERVAHALAPAHALEVVIVDDGSSDGTPAIARATVGSFSVKVVERSERGLATAVLRGFQEASGDVLGVMDADLSHPTDLLPTLLERLETHDLVLGSRNIPGGMVEEWPWYRVFASRFATSLVRPLGVRVYDPMSGFFLLHRRVLDGVACSPVGYKILLEILVKGHAPRVAEVPYVFRNREVGQSKMGLRESLNYLRHLGRLYAWKYGIRH